jgi:hypothetical protein
MKAKMIAADAAWCRHYGKRGRKGDQERRMLKRSERNAAKKNLRNGRD